jgi:hypothetical protein
MQAGTAVARTNQREVGVKRERERERERETPPRSGDRSIKSAKFAIL